MEKPEGAERDGLITQLCSVTGMTAENAGALLDAHQWKVDAAAATYFEMQAQDEQEQHTEQQQQQHRSATSSGDAATAAAAGQNTYARGQTLSGGTVSVPSIASASRTSNPKPKPKGGLRTLQDLQKESSSRGQRNDSDDDDNDNDDEQDFYAGGEKSGLAVQNPDTAADHVNEMLNRARRNIPRPGGDNPREQPTHFGGTGITLGGDDAPSRVIEDPNAKRQQRTTSTVERTLRLWQDGFSVDDGPLYRYDDPANAAMLAMINAGRAPLSILDVKHDDEVDLKLDERRGEKYTKPKPKYKPFSGSGQRLGSPVPGTDGASTSSAAASSSDTSQAKQSTETSTSASGAGVSVNESEPTVSLQIRLGDGTRLQSRFNTSHTIGDVYSFVDAARAGGNERAYALMTTFPSRELSDRSVALGELSEFKRGGVIVQKWTS